jgi:Spx/MgsR family transcriptional regulator
MTITLYGIPNCDTVKKARAWLQAQGQEAVFVDFKKHPPSAALLAAWCGVLDWTVLLNRKGSTWRQLSVAQQARAVDALSACALMQQSPSLIKRPVVDWGAKGLSVGFEPDAWVRHLP